MSYITDLPSSGGIWFDSAEGWLSYGGTDEFTLKGDGFDHVDNGPYAVSRMLYMGRTFVCNDDLLYHFDFCHMDLEENSDWFRVYGSLYTEDKPHPLSLHETWEYSDWYNFMDVQYDSGSLFDDLGETLPEEDQLNVWKKEHYSYRISGAYGWKCQSIADIMVSSTDHIGYHIATFMHKPRGEGVIAIRDFNARCIRNTVDYNIFALSDPSDSIGFGFQTGPDNTPKASKATVVIDLYGDKGSDFLRCHHFGVKASTSYACYSRSDNVFSISSDHNTDNLEHKLIIRAFEHDGMDILAAFVGSAELMAESIYNVASAGLQEYRHVPSNTLWVKFALTKSDTETTIVFEDSSVDPYSINGIDAEYGTIKTEPVDEVSVQFEWNYDSDAGDCMWDANVDESINAIQPVAGNPWGATGTAGSIAVVVGDIASKTAMFAHVAGALPVIGNAAMAVSNIANLYSGGGPSTEELTQDALKNLKSGTDAMIECNQQVAADKMNALKEAIDEALKTLQENIEAQIDAAFTEVVYKVHIENVEQEITGLEDTVDRIQRQWGYIDEMTDNDEILDVLKNILDNSMDGFGLGIVKKLPDSDFDYFWRLYSKEMTLYLQEILALRFNIWTMWLSYNGIHSDDSDKSIKDIEPDFHLEFLDLTSELIGEYIHLLPMAILTIMKPEYSSSELQPMTMPERFREIELRFQPILICEWMEMTLLLTETDDIYFLGDSADLYDDNADECVSKVRTYIINEVVRVDNSRNDDTQIIFGKESVYSSVVHQYHFFEESPNGYGCSYEWPESNDCLMMRNIYTNNNQKYESIDDVEGFLKLYTTALLIKETKYVAPGIIEISNSETFRMVELNKHYTNSDGDVQSYPFHTFSVSCSDGYRISGIRFGTAVFSVEENSKDDNEVSDDADVVKYDGENIVRRDGAVILIDYDDVTWDVKLSMQQFGSRSIDTYETIAVKLLCRPIPQSKRDLYDTFTDYEIVTKIPDDDNMKEKELKEVSWDEWKACPIGTFIDSIWHYWEQETAPVHIGYKLHKIIPGVTEFWDSFYKERPISWLSKMKIRCYDGDQEHTYHSLLNDEDISFSSFDIYSNSFKSDHFGTLILLLMVLALAQCLCCLYQRKKATKRIVHFDQETSDDENVM